MVASFSNNGSGLFKTHSFSSMSLLPFSKLKSLLEDQTESGHSSENSKFVLTRVPLTYIPMLEPVMERSIMSSCLRMIQFPSMSVYSWLHLNARTKFRFAPSLILASTLLNARDKVSIHNSPSKVSSPLLLGTKAM